MAVYTSAASGVVHKPFVTSVSTETKIKHQETFIATSYPYLFIFVVLGLSQGRAHELSII
jgi:hypothetical protein